MKVVPNSNERLVSIDSNLDPHPRSTSPSDTTYLFSIVIFYLSNKISFTL